MSFLEFHPVYLHSISLVKVFISNSAAMFTVTKALIATLATVGAVNALPQVQPKPSTNATAPTVPAPTEDQAQLFRDLFSAPTAIKRFQRLLTEGQTLLTGAALKKFTVFDFNGAMPATGAKGGATKSAVSCIEKLFHEVAANGAYRMLRLSLSYTTWAFRRLSAFWNPAASTPPMYIPARLSS